MRVWTDYELNFLKENYSSKGLEFCLKNLNKNKRQLRSKIQRMGLKLDPNPRYEFENFKKSIESSINLVDVCRKLGLNKNYGNRQTIKKYIEFYKLDISHFYIPSSKKSKKLTLKDILIENSEYRDTTHLKEKLYKENIKNHRCELCGQGEEWNGKKMSLILDHINGINNDNRIENLRIVCPNCNATLETHCKGVNQISKKFIKKEKIFNFCKCGKKIDKQSESCIECGYLKQRKVERPSFDQLLKEIEELGYCGSGRKYGVSDNAIRKWIKNKRIGSSVG